MTTTKNAWEYQLVAMPDGRDLEVLVSGPPSSRALVSFTGTPGGAVPDEALADEARAHGLLLLQPLRPGYGRSSPQPGRRVVEFAADVAVLLEHFNVADAVCMGGSGGGPHALAMAARLAACRAAAPYVSPAPRDAQGLDYYEGMGLSNQEEWLLADQGEAVVRPWLVDAAAQLLPGGSTGFLELYPDTMCPPDREVFDTTVGEAMTARFAKALETGIEGWVEDDIALTTPWGFGLEEVQVPVTLWAGRQDQFVSYRHSVWMAERIASCDLHLFADDGHVSLKLRHLSDLVADLVRRAGW